MYAQTIYIYIYNMSLGVALVDGPRHGVQGLLGRGSPPTFMHIYIYIYIYTHREREIDRYG